jgi:hypothetical protein
MSLINTMSSSKRAYMSHVYPAGPQTLKVLVVKCLFLRSCTAWKLLSNFSAWKPPPSFGWQNKCHIHTANISRQSSYLACMGYACRSSLYLWPSLQLKWNRSPFMDQSLSVIGMWGSCVRETTACCNNKRARFHNTETFFEGIITQKCFVKKWSWNFRNLGRKNRI